MTLAPNYHGAVRGQPGSAGMRWRRRSSGWWLVAVIVLIVPAVAVFRGSADPGCGSVPPDPDQGRTEPAADKVLDFAGAAGSRADPDIWSYDTGGNGWGNGELQNYTDSVRNSALDGDGNLVITARREETRSDGKELEYTSARLTTRDGFEVRQGSYIEAVIDPPVADGVWPAFWLLGSDLAEVGWPASGELDVMEIFGRSAVSQYVHLPTLSDPKVDKPFGGRADGGNTELDASAAGSPHRFGVFFDQTEVRFYVDRRQTLQLTADEARRSGRAWPFDQPFFILVNVAVGARSGQPDGTDFPRRMTVGPISVWTNGPPFEDPRC